MDRRYTSIIDAIDFMVNINSKLIFQLLSNLCSPFGLVFYILLLAHFFGIENRGVVFSIADNKILTIKLFGNS